MKSMVREVKDGDLHYICLTFVCPGCIEFGGSGLHLLPVNSTTKSPSWDWDGDLEKPTLSPSILTGKDSETARCHSFLSEGVFQFLEDSTHSLAGQYVPIPDLPDWFVTEKAD